MATFAGVFGPVVTTLDARGEVDLDTFGRNIEAHITAGLNGVVVAGSTGEAALLDESERLRLIEMARAVVPSERLLIVGAGAESTRLCVRRCRDAAARGAQAVLVVAPHYYASAMTNSALQAHYERVADESPIPVLLYNIPKYMHFKLDGDLVQTLSRHENIVGMKDSSGDMAYFPQYLACQDENFSVLTGHGGTFAQALALGARGGILAVALFAPALALDVFRSAVAGDHAAAERAQARMTPMALEIVGRMGIGAVKAAMERVGLDGGSVRMPLLNASAADVAEVERLLDSAGLRPT